MKETADCDRLDKRATVLLRGRCRNSGWKVFDVELDNISTGGCCIVDGRMRFEPAQSLSLRFANFRKVDAKVRWIAGQRVGVEFQTPLKRRVIEALARTYGIAIGSARPAGRGSTSQIIDLRENDFAAPPS